MSEYWHFCCSGALAALASLMFAMPPVDTNAVRQAHDQAINTLRARPLRVSYTGTTRNYYDKADIVGMQPDGRAVITNRSSQMTIVSPTGTSTGAPTDLAHIDPETKLPYWDMDESATLTMYGSRCRLDLDTSHTLVFHEPRSKVLVTQRRNVYWFDGQNTTIVETYSYNGATQRPASITVDGVRMPFHFSPEMCFFDTAVDGAIATSSSLSGNLLRGRVPGLDGHGIDITMSPSWGYRIAEKRTVRGGREQRFEGAVDFRGLSLPAQYSRIQKRGGGALSFACDYRGIRYEELPSGQAEQLLQVVLPSNLDNTQPNGAFLRAGAESLPSRE